MWVRAKPHRTLIVAAISRAFGDSVIDARKLHFNNAAPLGMSPSTVVKKIEIEENEMKYIFFINRRSKFQFFLTCKVFDATKTFIKKFKCNMIAQKRRLKQRVTLDALANAISQVNHKLDYLISQMSQQYYNNGNEMYPYCGSNQQFGDFNGYATPSTDALSYDRSQFPDSNDQGYCQNINDNTEKIEINCTPVHTQEFMNNSAYTPNPYNYQDNQAIAV